MKNPSQDSRLRRLHLRIQIIVDELLVLRRVIVSSAELVDWSECGSPLHPRRARSNRLRRLEQAHVLARGANISRLSGQITKTGAFRLSMVSMIAQSHSSARRDEQI
jgi:hypothetical protein